jgi:hypothetical protein
MKLHVACLLALTTAAAHADTIVGDQNEYGKVTRIRKGVKELDLGGMFVLSHSKSGDAEGQTRLTSLGGPGFQVFINDNIAVGGTVLLGYELAGADQKTLSFGGSAHGQLSMRLGLGAFLRPTVALGFLTGSQDTEVTPGMLVSASQNAFLVRIALPIAYFASRRILLQAGPELNMMFGSITPDGVMGGGQSFSTIAGGFGVSAGYVF